jgi:hypothetical protein
MIISHALQLLGVSRSKLKKLYREAHIVKKAADDKAEDVDKREG